MSDIVKVITQLITEDPNVFTAYQDKFRNHTVLDAEVFGEIVGILQDVASENGLVLDRSKLKVRFNPAGISIKNIHLDAPNSSIRRKLANRIASVTGDDNIKHTFGKNLRVNLYQAISGEFANRVREELNLEVTHQSRDPKDANNPSELLPMATFTQPAVTAEPPEEEFDIGEPMGPEPGGGPKSTSPGEEPGIGGGNFGEPLEDLPELQNDNPGEFEGEKIEEPEVGSFGVEPPKGGEETEGGEEEPAEEGEREETTAAESIIKIASIITEDPDIFTF